MIPLVGVQMIGANCFQYVGKVKESVFLSALRQLLLLNSLLLFLPSFLGLTGVWLATPLSDIFAFLVTAVMIRRALKDLERKGNLVSA